MRDFKIMLLAAVCALAPGMIVSAQDAPSQATFNYPMSYDSVKASPKNHRLLYEDAHVRLIEVTLFPHDQEFMHGHPYPSVFAYDSAAPEVTNVTLDAAASAATLRGAEHKTGAGAYPYCKTMGPQAPHAATAQGDFPDHFYRIEFKRIDGADLAKNWRSLYPKMAESLQRLPDVKIPAGAKPFSKQWPYPIEYDSYKAAPNNHAMLYQDGHVRFIEVTIRPGEKENFHGHPYYSVFAFDSPTTGVSSGPSKTVNSSPDPAHPTPEPVILGNTDAPPGMDFPKCQTMAPQGPHAVLNGGDVPMHFYRLEFIRVDGEDFKTHWREWYPRLAKGPVQPTSGQ